MNPSITLTLQQASTDNDVPDSEQMRAWLAPCCALLPSCAQVLVRLVDEAESQQLNQQYRHKPGPTNILSFPFELPPGFDPAWAPQDEPQLLGDLVICVSVVKQQAQAQHKPLAAHWAHMLIHGLLHLLGYDHIDNNDAQIMEALEIQYLAQLGWPDPYAATPH